MNKPISIFVCGVQKGGTTSLHTYFTKHPEISTPRYKEIHFFDNEKLDWNSPNYSQLDKFFNTEDDQKLRCDITPIYGFWPPSISRISAYNAHAKLIFLFRDPFDRAWSQWCMEYVRKTENLPFHDAIREEQQRIKDLPLLADQRRIYAYVERGFYAKQVRRALNYFPRKNMLFLRSRDLLTDHRSTLAKSAEFLNIAPFPDVGLLLDHKRPQVTLPSSPTEADRLYVADIVRNDLLEFTKLTGIDISDWPTMR